MYSLLLVFMLPLMLCFMMNNVLYKIGWFSTRLMKTWMLLMVADNLINFNTCHGKLLVCNFHIHKEICKNKLWYFNSSAHGIGGWVPFRGHKSPARATRPHLGLTRSVNQRNQLLQNKDIQIRGSHQDCCCSCKTYCSQQKRFPTKGSPFLKCVVSIYCP